MAKAAIQAATETAAFRPSVVLALAQAPLDAEGVGLVRQADPETTLAFWFVEDFRRFGYLADVAPAYDLVFHIQGDLLNTKLKSWGVPLPMYIPAAADEAVFSPGPIDSAFAAKVSMMGAGYPNRRHILSALAKGWKTANRSPDDFKIFGDGWDGAESLAPHLFEGGRRLSPIECAAVFRSTAVNLNIHSGLGQGLDPEGAFVNPRTFEVAACAGFQIVDNRSLFPDLFSRLELTTFEDPRELPDLIESALANPDQRIYQADAACRKVLTHHLYRHRLDSMLEFAGAFFPRRD
jgi:spore maturation protein CgeB